MMENFFTNIIKHSAIEKILPFLNLFMMILFLLSAFIIAPTEIVEGEVQRIFYFHLPTALASYMCFGLTFLFSILYLWKKKIIYNHWGKASALIGVFFTIICLWSGMAWGKPTWGVWWTWDARLTSTLILLLLYIGYLLVQSLEHSSEGRTNRIAAFIGIIAFMDIPIINMSVRWWRTLHPQPIVLAPISENRLPAEMLVVLIISTIAILLLAIWLIIINVRILKNEHTIRQILSQSFNKGEKY